MDGRDSVRSLLVLRKLTRAIADAVRQQMTEYLATLAPLLRPQTVLGDYIQGGAKEATRKADKALKELQGLYEGSPAPGRMSSRASWRRRSGSWRRTWRSRRSTTRMSCQSGSEKRTIMVRSPLTWTLTYTGFAPSRLPELAKANFKGGDELQQFVLAYLLMHVVTTNSPGLLKAFDALHFPITTTTLPDFGPLPITRIGIVGVSTSRPSDAVIVESAELTGMDAFEEVINVDELSTLRDPFKERLLAIAREQAPSSCRADASFSNT